MPSTSSKRVFSTSKTSPSLRSLTDCSSVSPRVSGTKVTSSPNFSVNALATGFKVNAALSLSSFTLPRCENNTTFPPCSMMYLIVGKA